MVVLKKESETDPEVKQQPSRPAGRYLDKPWDMFAIASTRKVSTRKWLMLIVH